MCNTMVVHVTGLEHEKEVPALQASFSDKNNQHWYDLVKSGTRPDWFCLENTDESSVDLGSLMGHKNSLCLSLK